ncbi:MAG TPA: hypothetical protein VFU43_01830 [Streptosporangiaceae bacterium]|nr:hypothetical protein [Streptosporangiaceae bacterium]
MTSQVDFARFRDPAGATSANPVTTAVSDDALLRAIAEVRAAFARAHAKVAAADLVADAIGHARDLERLDLPALSAAAREAGNPAAALTHAVHQSGDRLDRGAVRDIFDSGTLLVTQRALPFLQQELRRAECAIDRLARREADEGVAEVTGVRRRRLLTEADQRLGTFIADGLPVALGGLAEVMMNGVEAEPCGVGEPALGTYTLAGFLEFPIGDDPTPPPVRGAHTFSGYLPPPESPERDIRACLDELAAAFAAESGLAAPTPPWQPPHGLFADLTAALTVASSALYKMADAAASGSGSGHGSGAGAGSATTTPSARTLAVRLRRTAGDVSAVGADLLRRIATDDERSPDSWNARWRLLRDCLLLSGSAFHDGRRLADDLAWTAA